MCYSVLMIKGKTPVLYACSLHHIISAVTETESIVTFSIFYLYWSHQPLQIMMFWVFTVYSVICCFQYFEGIYCYHHQSDWLRWLCPLELGSCKPRRSLKSWELLSAFIIAAEASLTVWYDPGNRIVTGSCTHLRSNWVNCILHWPGVAYNSLVILYSNCP